MISDKELAEMQARCDTQTTAPWVIEPVDNVGIGISWDIVGHSGQSIVCSGTYDSDAQFIAAARTDLPRCIEEIKRLRKTLEWYADESIYGTWEEKAFNRLEIEYCEGAIDNDKGEYAREALGNQ